MAGSRALTGRFGIVLAILALASTACRNADSRIQQHQEKFDSLTATVQAIGEAWLTGKASTRYASSAMVLTFALIEQEQQALASTPDLVIDARGAQLSQASERLARTVAGMIRDVRSRDAASLHEHLADLPRQARDQR
jgi:hypothetical protein